MIKDGPELGVGGLNAISALPQLNELVLVSQLNAGDHQWRRILNGASGLRFVFLKAPGIADATIHCLAEMPGLEEAYLIDSAITDEGLSSIAGHSRLRRLVIRGGTVTIDGVIRLKGNRVLQELWIDNKLFSREERSRVQNLMPWCRIKLTAAFECPGIAATHRHTRHLLRS